MRNLIPSYLPSDYFTGWLIIEGIKKWNTLELVSLQKSNRTCLRKGGGGSSNQKIFPPGVCIDLLITFLWMLELYSILPTMYHDRTELNFFLSIQTWWGADYRHEQQATGNKWPHPMSQEKRKRSMFYFP